MKKIRLLIVILTILIIISLASLVILKNIKGNENNFNESNMNDNDNGVYINGEDENLIKINPEIHLVEEKNVFYTVENVLKKANNNCYAIKIWEYNIDDYVASYYVKTYIKDIKNNNINYTEKYYIVVLDYENMTYNIDSESEKYSKEKLNDISKISKQTNSKNVFEYFEYTDQYVVNSYFDEYIREALFKPEEAYNLLDEEYKKEKYDTFAKYKEYLDKNKEKIENSLIEKYSVENYDDYTQYTLVDNYDNTYIIKEKSVMNFTIELDDYTTNLSKIDESYNQATDEEKIKTNMDLLIKMINNKDYEQIYDKYLNSSFKDKYFANKTSFSQYMSKNFFDYNYVDSETYVKEDNYFVISIHYKSREGLSAEENSKKIIMRLGESINDFQISFIME